MDLHSKMTMYITSTMTSPVTKTAKISKWLKLYSKYFEYLKNISHWVSVVRAHRNRQ